MKHEYDIKQKFNQLFVFVLSKILGGIGLRKQKKRKTDILWDHGKITEITGGRISQAGLYKLQAYRPVVCGGGGGGFKWTTFSADDD